MLVSRPVFTHGPPGPGPRAANFQGRYINLLEPEFYILILAHPVGKMRVIQKPNKVAL